VVVQSKAWICGRSPGEIVGSNSYGDMDLTFRGPCIVIYSYNKTKDMHQFLKFIFGIELYMFRAVSLSIIRSLVLYTQQQEYVIQVMLISCKRDQDGAS